MAALAEILPMSVKMGLDPEKVGEVINGGTGSSFASEFFIPRILNDNFSDGYSLENAYKDLVSAAELSLNLRIPLPLVQAATTTYQMALLRGYGEQDKGAMIRVFEELLAAEYRKP
jgi:3-hydroxyisobutyrate dehydrogenase-like beta-hydroxyacid dehydrogenase